MSQTYISGSSTAVLCWLTLHVVEVEEACGDNSTSVWLRSYAHSMISPTYDQQQQQTSLTALVTAHREKSNSPPKNLFRYQSGFYHLFHVT